MGKGDFIKRIIHYFLALLTISGISAIFNVRHFFSGHSFNHFNASFQKVLEDFGGVAWHLPFLAYIFYFFGAAVKGRNLYNLIFWFILGSSLFPYRGNFAGPVTAISFLNNLFAVLFFNIGLNTHSEIRDKKRVIFEGLKQGFFANLITSLVGSLLGSFIAGLLMGLIPVPMGSYLVNFGVFFISFFGGVLFSGAFGQFLGEYISPKTAGSIGGFVGGLIYGLAGLGIGYIISFCLGIFFVTIPLIFLGLKLSGYYLDLYLIGPIGAVLGFQKAVSMGVKTGRSVGEKGFGNGNGGFGGAAFGGLRGIGRFGGFGGGFSGGGGGGGIW